MISLYNSFVLSFRITSFAGQSEDIASSRLRLHALFLILKLATTIGWQL